MLLNTTPNWPVDSRLKAALVICFDMLSLVSICRLILILFSRLFFFCGCKHLVLPERLQLIVIFLGYLKSFSYNWFLVIKSRDLNRTFNRCGCGQISGTAQPQLELPLAIMNKNSPPSIGRGRRTSHLYMDQMFEIKHVLLTEFLIRWGVAPRCL